MKFLLMIFVVAVVVLSTGCVVHNETLYVAGELVTVRFEDNKPRVRVSTGLDECKWRAKGNISEDDYSIRIECKVNTDVFKVY